MTKSNPQLHMRADDQTQRRRAIEDVDFSFVVEASAGTGKTSTLINRILHLVLEGGPGGPPLPLSCICAITFTEKAAGEMRMRLRQHFDQILRDGRESAGRLERASQALNDLETASISTFHSFAVSLLKERPIEAELDPNFTALDDIQSEIFFRKVWEPWISRALEERNPTLEQALRNGFRMESLKNLSGILRLNWLTVRDLECDSPPAEEQYLDRIQSLLLQGQAFLPRLIKAEDKLSDHLEKALVWLKHPGDGCIELSKPGNAGSAANWEGGKETVQAVRGFLKEVLECAAAYKNLPSQQLLGEVVRWIKEDFMKNEWERRKRAGGLLDFDDQLRIARDLLRNPAVRRAFQARYKSLLVDEFQDTDPIQWEIVLLLSSSNVKEADFAKLQPEAGRLFIVGDPKQSIYRFRNADIETYLGIVEPHRMNSLGLGQPLRLTTNFRSVPSILHFVDEAFKGIMKSPEDGCRYQPDYVAFEDHGGRKTELNPPAVSLLVEENDESGSKRTVREFIQRESSQIAKLIRRIHGSESWKIHDMDEKEGAVWRVPRYGDIAVLLPVLTHTEVLEDELRDHEIPYVLEGGKFYYARSEVSSAITLLRAIANPNDSVALYGSLRSIFFGLSDEDLLKAHIEKLPLDYRERVSPESSLHYPFEVMRDLHIHRYERRASETFEILLQKTGAREVLAAHGFQSLANLNKLSRTLRALQGDATFSQVVDLLSTMDAEGLAESESRLMEERGDAVRIMSIHKAKGLDFPIVFVAGLGLRKQTRGQSLLAEPHRRKVFALNVKLRNSTVHTVSWKELFEEEKKRENAELVRLLYVGLTRARDHLIIGTHTAGWKKPGDDDPWVLDTGGTRLEPLDSFLAHCLSGEKALARLIRTGDTDQPSRAHKTVSAPVGKDWRAIAESEYEELRTLLQTTPSSRSLQAAGQWGNALQNEDRSLEAAESRAIRLGVAFHEAMERVDLLSLEDLAECVQEAGIRHKLDRGDLRELEEMVRASLSSDLLSRVRAAARTGGRILRELPFTRRRNRSAIEEGKVDMLFEEAGVWILVDYKTDRMPENAADADRFIREKYSSQIQEYIAALRALSVKVEDAYVLLARTGDSIKIA